MRRAAVITYKGAPRSETMLLRNLQQRRIVRFERGVKDDANVHHDIDEVGIRAVKRAQTPGAFVKTKCKRSARMYHDVFQRLVRCSGSDGRFIPAFVRAVIEDETEIVNLAIVFAWFECT